MQTKQRRRFQRAHARLPVWVKRPETGTVLQGHTANVCAGGMYLLTAVDCEFPIGVDVSVVFGIRSDDHGGFELHKVVQGAEVVRLERHGYGTGIAVKFTESDFCRCENEPNIM